MRKNKINIAIIFIALSSFIFSCNKNTKTDKAIAKVYDNVLYLEEIEDVIPNNINKEDSIYIAQSYINNWIKTQLYLVNAQKNLSDEQMDFEKEILAYKNALIIHTYQQEILKEKCKNLDVSQEELVTYYHSHKEEFTSNENYYQLRYFIGPKSSLQKEELRTLIKEKNNANDFETYCLRHAIDYSSSNNKWTPLEEIIQVFPSEMQKEIRNTHKKRMIEYSDSLNYYAIMIFNIQEENEIENFEIVKDEIKEIILFEKKNQFIKDFEEEMFSEAEKKANIEIFTQ